jgi:hypothetical protein
MRALAAIEGRRTRSQPPGLALVHDALGHNCWGLVRNDAFFDGLAQLHRTAYLRWINATKGRPEVRAERITEAIALLNDGIKQRPEPPND